MGNDVNTLLDTWITCPIPNPNARLRLIIFPYAGAGTAIFRPWIAGLPSEIEVCMIRLPGRESRLREAPYQTMQPLVEALETVVKPLLDKPFVFYGHSMGALVAFELTRALRRAGEKLPLHLILSARRAPQLPDPDPAIHMLPDDAFVEKMQARYGGIPEVILKSPELMELFIPVLKADFAVIETYSYQPEAPLELPISVFGGTNDHIVREGHIEGWREQTTGAFTSQKFVGTHFFIQSEQAAFLRTISQILKLYI